MQVRGGIDISEPKNMVEKGKVVGNGLKKAFTCLRTFMYAALRGIRK